MRTRLPPIIVYLILEGCTAFFFTLIFNVNLVYHIARVQLTPLQLVLVGTILEGTIFLFEIPTGVVADVKSRRLSVIIGYTLMGIGFIVEGALPFFSAIALAQVLWGLGYTFTSGATQAWMVDEVGEAHAGPAFLRGAQAGKLGGLLAIPVSTALGMVAVQLPIVSGGIAFLGLAGFLAITMTETGFTPTPAAERTTWEMLRQTLQDAWRLQRRQPALLGLLSIGWFYGLYSEGFDRLWTAHLLGNFDLPLGLNAQPVVLLGALNSISAILGLISTEIVRRRVDIQTTAPLARILAIYVGIMVVALAGFGLARTFWLALLTFWLFGIARGITGPLHTAWFNLRIDEPQVRATLFSASSQADAIGQIVGGPIIGAIGNTSLRAAFIASAAILAPVTPLYRFTLHQENK